MALVDYSDSSSSSGDDSDDDDGGAGRASDPPCTNGRTPTPHDRMALVDYSDSSSSSGDDSDDDDGGAGRAPDPPCTNGRTRRHAGAPRVSLANRRYLRAIAASVVVPRSLEQRRLREFCARSRGALQFYTDAPGSTVELNRELAALHGPEAGRSCGAAGPSRGARRAFSPPPAFEGEGHGTRMRRRERALLLSSLTAREPDEPPPPTSLEQDEPQPSTWLEGGDPLPQTAREQDEPPPTTVPELGEPLPPPTPPPGSEVAAPSPSLARSPPPTDDDADDEEGDDRGTAILVPPHGRGARAVHTRRSLVGRMETDDRRSPEVTRGAQARSGAQRAEAGEGAGAADSHVRAATSADGAAAPGVGAQPLRRPAAHPAPSRSPEVTRGAQARSGAQRADAGEGAGAADGAHDDADGGSPRAAAPVCGKRGFELQAQNDCALLELVRRLGAAEFATAIDLHRRDAARLRDGEARAEAAVRAACSSGELRLYEIGGDESYVHEGAVFCGDAGWSPASPPPSRIARPSAMHVRRDRDGGGGLLVRGAIDGACYFYRPPDSVVAALEGQGLAVELARHFEELRRLTRHIDSRHSVDLGGGGWHSVGYRGAMQKGERGVVPYYPQPGASFAAVADWRRRAMPALRQVVAAVMLHVFLELRKSALVLRRVAAQLAELPDLLLWDFSPFISLAAGINYYAAQHTDDDGGLCVCLFAWGGRRGEMPPGGEFVMSGLAFPGGFGLACELTEFDVVVFDAHKLHGLARLWGQDPPDAARFSVGLYVPNAVVQNIKRAAVGGCRESGKVRTLRRREARAAAAAERV